MYGHDKMSSEKGSYPIQDYQIQYDDNPSLFLTWKLTFKNIMQEISATPSEELDVLVSHLGIDSSRQAATFKKCNADNPETALNLVWERL